MTNDSDEDKKDEQELPTKKGSDFNMVKATFFLVAFIFFSHVFGLLLAEVHCLYWLSDKCAEVADGKILQGFAELLAAALAFAAGQSSVSSKRN